MLTFYVVADIVNLITVFGVLSCKLCTLDYLYKVTQLSHVIIKLIYLTSYCIVTNVDHATLCFATGRLKVCVFWLLSILQHFQVRHVLGTSLFLSVWGSAVLSSQVNLATTLTRNV